jgi:hypothetical protein
MTCSWRWFIHPETAISRKRNGAKTLWGFKAHYRDYRAMVEPSQTHTDPVFGPYGVRSIKEECLSKLILFGQSSLRRVVSEYLEHYHQERNHQGKGNLLLFPTSTLSEPDPHCAIRCRERLGGLLKYYRRAA